MTPWDAALLNVALYLVFTTAGVTFLVQFFGHEWIDFMLKRDQDRRDRDHVKDDMKPPGAGPGSMA